MKFIVEVDQKTLDGIKEFYEQSQGIFPESPEEIIRLLFLWADMGSGWLKDLPFEVKVSRSA